MLTLKLRPTISAFRNFLIVYGLLATFIYLFQLGGSFYSAISTLVFLVPFLVLLFSQRSVIDTLGGNAQQLGFKLIFIGVSLATLGQILWFVFHFILKSDLINFIPPILFFSTYFLAFSGFTVIARALRVNWRSYPGVLIGFILLGIILGVIISRVGGLTTVFNQGAPLIVTITNLGYVVGDISHIIIIYLILQIVLLYGKGLLGRYWLSLLTGHFLILIGDVSVAFFFKPYNMGVWPFTLIDLMFLGGYLFNAHAFYGISDTIRLAQAKISAHGKK